MIRIGLAMLCAFTSAVLAGQPATAPPPPPTPEQEFLVGQLDTLATELQQQPVLPARALSEILRLTLVEGQFKLEILAKDVIDAGTIPLKGVNGVCIIQRFGEPQLGDPSITVSIHVLERESLRSTNVNVSSISTRFNLDVILASPGGAIYSQLISTQEGPFTIDEVGAKLYVQAQSDDENATATPRTERSAPSPAELIGTNHEQFLDSCGPGFQLLRAMHLLSGMSERQVNHLLASQNTIPAEIQRDISAALSTLEADPDAGEKRLKSILDKLGPTAAAALAHVSRVGWSADLTMRVDTILAPYLPDDPRATDNAIDQPARMVDLLYWPDESIRIAVLRHLRSLSREPITFDPSKDPYSQVSEIEALRSRFAQPD